MAQMQQSLGIFGSWGAFREDARCYAIARPEGGTRDRERKAFAAIGYWPNRGARGQVYFRLSQPKRPASALLLRIDDRTFELSGGGDNAWAPNPEADAEIVAATPLHGFVEGLGVALLLILISPRRSTDPMQPR